MWRTAFRILVIILLITFPGDRAEPNGDGSDPVASGPAFDAEAYKGRFFARVELRDDLERVDAFFAEVKVFPALSSWPNVKIDTENVFETNIRALIHVRGISVPSRMPNRARPHIQVERERRRFDAAIHYLWDIVKNSETLILENVVEDTENRVFRCDVAVLLGGQEIDLARMLVTDGHAAYQVEETHWDWGAPNVRPVPINE